MISQATQAVETMLQTSEGTQQVEDLFQTCTSFQTIDDITNFMTSLMGNFMTTVQYNDEAGNPIDIKYLCNIMDNATATPLENYAKINSLFLQIQGMSCLPVDYDQMIQQLANDSLAAQNGDRQWTYQTCTEFGYFQTTDSPNQPFGNLVPLTFWTNMCADLGWTWNVRINETNDNYGGNHPGGTKILFVNGSLDPWHALSVTQDLSHSKKALLIEGTAHCANMFPESPTDPPSLIAARHQISKQIGKWLAQ